MPVAGGVELRDELYGVAGKVLVFVAVEISIAVEAGAENSGSIRVLVSLDVGNPAATDADGVSLNRLSD